MEVWNTGSPRTVGVYCASIERNPDARRHWDGRRWSAPWYHSDPEEIAMRAARAPAECPVDIEWCEVA